MVFLLCYCLPMIERAWEGCTLQPDRLENQTPAWMCLTREGDDAKVRRDKKNARARKGRRKYKPVQFLLAFCAP